MKRLKIGKGDHSRKSWKERQYNKQKKRTR